MKSLTWMTGKRKLSQLKALSYNPRTLTEEQKKQLRRSLEKFGYVEIAAINTDGTIIAGHQRIGLLIELGLGNKTFDVRIPSRKLTAAEVREYNIRSNKNTGQWDEKLLNDNFALEDLLDWGFNRNELPEAEEKGIVKEEVLKPYNKMHILISLDPTHFHKVSPLLDQFKDMKEIEIEQSAN